MEGESPPIINSMLPMQRAWIGDGEDDVTIWECIQRVHVFGISSTLYLGFLTQR